MVSKKCEYALRAIFELVRSDGNEAIKIQEIASAQDIPFRFLEVILVELKHGGFVSSKRGNKGGYVLARKAGDIAVGEIIAFFEGGWDRGMQGGQGERQRVGDLAFSHLWDRAKGAISQIYDQTTFKALLEEEITARHPEGWNYVI